jgi:1,4-dihydroxy-6-naphthoate synthase
MTQIDNKKTHLTIGFSPCPNDTYIFNAMINGLIPNQDLEYNCVMEDVEVLNKLSMKEEIDVVKISYFAYSKISEKYQLLRAGGALGSNCGPILVSNSKGEKPTPESLIAIPGFNTTANLLLSLAYPECTFKEAVLFSDIESGVIEGRYDFGLIIHESRFTYKSKGLHKVMDLGEYWEGYKNLPIPLGAIAIKRSLPEDVKLRINNYIRDSILFANDHVTKTMEFVKVHAQEMQEEVMKAHINLYVNDYSLDVGTKGKEAVDCLFEEISFRDKVVFHKPIFIS